MSKKDKKQPKEKAEKKKEKGEAKVPFFLKAIAKAVEKEGQSLDMRAVTLSEGERIRWAVSTGSLAIDLICGGGYGVGRFMSPFGPEASGKTTGALEAVAEALLMGIPCIYYDAENALDVEYFDRIVYKKTGFHLSHFMGVTDAEGNVIKPGLLYYVQPSSCENCFNHATRIADSIPDIVKNKKLGWCWLQKGEGNKKDTLEPREEEGNVSILYVIDSLKALVPQAKKDNDEASPLAQQARALSDSFPNLVERMKRKRLCVIYTNQVRSKIGVMFGCLHAETPIRLRDGSVYSMKELVENKIKGEVLSYNEKTNKLEYKKIKNWFYNGEVSEKSDWCSIRTLGINTKNGLVDLTVTRNHKFMTEKGWKEAKDLTYSDRIMTPVRSVINGTLSNFLSGSFCGDSTIVFDRKTQNSYFKLQNNEQKEYNDWKLAKLSVAFSFNHYEDKRGFDYYVSNTSYELNDWYYKISNRNPTCLKETFNILSLAVLFMDDGHSRLDEGRCTASISFGRYKNDRETLFAISEMISNIGYPNYVVVSDGIVGFERENFLKLSKDICSFVPPCMQYKLPEQFRGKYKDFKLKFKEDFKYEYSKILQIREGSDRKFRKKGKYDICVEGNHNYLAGSSSNGVIVHNSPEFEPCGDAAKFYSSTRIRYASCATSTVDKDFFKTSGTDGEGKGQVDVEMSWDGTGKDRYRYAKIKTIKNKQFSPYQETFIRFRYEKAGQQGDGIDPSFDVYAYLYQTGQCSKKSGKGLSISLFGYDKDEPFPRKIAAYLGDLKKLEKNLSKDKENKLKTFDAKLTWLEFKELVENPERKNAFHKLCKKQMETGFAWALYFANKNASKEKEDESED